MAPFYFGKSNFMSAEAEIRRRISGNGPITFAEFMEVALYWPDGGYYASGDRVGAAGDFFTSPLAHPGFGALITVQLLQMWQVMGCPDLFTVVELGAGDGLLCRDIIAFASVLPGNFKDCLRYVCIDRGAAAGHERGLESIDRIVADALPLRGVVGCVLSNELLDAFPVHQVVMEGGSLREVFVTLEGEDLAACTGEPSTPALGARLDSLGVTLEEGQTAEINLVLDSWARAAAAALVRGFVLTFDYGRSARELYSPEERFRGTLTTFYQHVQTDSPFRRIGRQDITSQVDFTSVVRLGQQTGLEFLDITDQGSFLGNLGMEEMLMGRLRIVTSNRTEFAANRRGMLELVDPDGLGGFKVMAQGKNVGEPGLWGFGRGTPTIGPDSRIYPPLLTGDHLKSL